MQKIAVLKNSGIKIEDLSILKPVLDEWIKLINKEKWFFESDATWWNNERATLSIFAGAIWRYGGLVMEEFATEKIKKSKSKTGRCDIIFRIRESVYLAEAKQDWPLLTGTNLQTNIRETKKIIKKACHESLDTKDPNAVHLGIVFITPRAHGKNEKFLDDYLMSYVKALKVENNLTLAWQFPKWARKLRSTVDGFENYIYPGVILAIRKVY